MHSGQQKDQSKSHQMKYFDHQSDFFFRFFEYNLKWKRERMIPLAIDIINESIGTHLEMASKRQKHCHRRRFYLLLLLPTLMSFSLCFFSAFRTLYNDTVIMIRFQFVFYFIAWTKFELKIKIKTSNCV